MNNNDNSTRIFTDEIAKAGNISVSDQKLYRLPLFLRLARQVAKFSPDCEICQNLQIQIYQLGANLANRTLLTRQDLTDYLDMLKGVTKHLKRSHGLVEERQYIKRCVLAGFTFGISLVLLGLILLSLGITLLTLNITLTALVTRVLFGCTIGYLMDRRARRRGRVL